MGKLDDPDVPACETHNYRAIELNNKLKVLLISSDPCLNDDPPDPDWVVNYPMNYMNPSKLLMADGSFSRLQSLRSSLKCKRTEGGKFFYAFCINVGSINDPPQFQGLAHFTEHIIFHGSKNYPGENELDTFFFSEDGNAEAATDRVKTYYYGDIKSSEGNIRKAIKMHASMFTEPLLPIEAVEREIESVDNEFFMNKVYDERRVDHLFTDETILNNSHPLRQFRTGSKESLMSKSPNAVKELREATLKFVQTYYIGPNMTAVLMAPFSLDELEKVAIETLSIIPGPRKIQNDPICRAKSFEIPFEPSLFNRLFTMKPLSNDAHFLSITWIYEAEIWKNYQSKTFNYFVHIFNHSGQGGIKYYLRERKWTHSFNCATSNFGDIKNDYYTALRLEAELTTEGRDAVDEILRAIFSFVNMHRRAGPQSRIFDQIVAAETFNFNNFPLEKKVDSLVDYAVNMLFCEPKDALLGSNSIRSKYDPKLIKCCLDRMTPDKTNFTLRTHLHGPEQEFKTSKLYGTRYRIEEMSKYLSNELSNIQPYKDFCLIPPPNLYLQYPGIKKPVNVGTVAENFSFWDADEGILKFEPNPVMRSEQINFEIDFFTYLPSYATRAFEPALRVWNNLMLMETENKLHAQSDIKLKWDITMSHSCCKMTLSGLRNGFFEAFSSLIDSFEKNEFVEEDFKAAFEDTLNRHFYLLIEYPDAAESVLRQLKNPQEYSYYESYKNLKQLTFTEFLKILQYFKKNIWITASLKGFATRNEAVLVAQRLNKIKRCPLTSSALKLFNNDIEPRTLVPLGERCLRIKFVLPESKSFLVLNYYELGPKDAENDYLAKLVTGMMLRAFYYEVRTIEQLGYWVSSSLSSDETRNGIQLFILAHSEKFSPCYIDFRIETFLKTFYQKYFTSESITEQLAKDHHETLNAEEVQDFYKKYLLKDSPNSEFRKLSVQVLGDYLDKKDGCICDIKNYEKSVVCKKSEWLNEVAVIGKCETKIEIGSQLGNDRKCGKHDYFISSIAKYHKENN